MLPDSYQTVVNCNLGILSNKTKTAQYWLSGQPTRLVRYKNECLPDDRRLPPTDHSVHTPNALPGSNTPKAAREIQAHCYCVHTGLMKKQSVPEL